MKELFSEMREGKKRYLRFENTSIQFQKYYKTCTIGITDETSEVNNLNLDISKINIYLK